MRRSLLFLRLAVILLFLLAGTELFLRQWVLTPSRQTFDPQLGFTYLGDRDILHTNEGRARIRLNSLGLNAAPLPEIRAAAERLPTVLVLGDSYTEALQVARDRNFVSLAAQAAELNLVNAGRSGLGPLHYPALFTRLRDTIAPDALIICLTQGDIADARQTPYTLVRREGHNTISALNLSATANNRLRSFIEPLIHHSALATLMMRRSALVIGGWRWPWDDWPFPNAVTAQNRGAAQNPGTASHTDPQNPDDVYSAIIFQLAALRSEIPTALLYIPTFRYAAGGVILETAQSRRDWHIFEAIAAELSLPLVHAGDAMRADYARDHMPLTGFRNSTLGHGHLNENGHRAVAETLAAVARKLIARP